MKRIAYRTPTVLQEVSVCLERGLLQNSVVTDEMSVEVQEFEAVTFTNPDTGFEHDYFDAEFK